MYSPKLTKCFIILTFFLTGCSERQPKIHDKDRKAEMVHNSQEQSEIQPKPNTNNKNEVLALLKAFFNKKIVKPPFYYEYENSFLLDPFAPAGLESRTIIADEAGTYFTETKAPSWCSRFYFSENKVRWHYTDNEHGEYLFVGDVNLGKLGPESWLRDHHFVHNVILDFEKSLFSLLYTFLVPCEIVQDGNQLTCFNINAPQFRKLRITIDLVKGRLTISEVVEEQNARDRKGIGRERVLLFYYKSSETYKRPNDPRVGMLELFAKKKKETHVLRDHDDFMSVFDRLAGEPNKIEPVSIAKAKEFAKRYRLLFPRKNEHLIKKAEVYNDYLYLEIEKGGKRYTLGQFSGNPWEIPDNMVVQSRILNDFKIVDIKEFTHRYTYYITDRTIIMIDGPGHFNDPVLDGLILSFESLNSPFKKSKKP